ncbi:hypothetical protein MMC13_004794 [Lambiella insularis]|nr:hypothetical protein [Lambiella insularis]
MSNSTGNSTVTGTTSWAVYGYDLTMPLAWIGGIVFTLSALVHIFQYFKHRAWYLYLLMLGILMEVFGYWTRVLAIQNPSNNAAVFMTFLLTTLAPSFLAAGCYMTFGRIIYWVTPENRRGFRQVWIPARFVTMIFICLDMLSFTIQCIGIFFLIAKLSNSDRTSDQQNQYIKTTYNILRVGFIMQNIVFGVFTIVVLRFMFASKAWKFDWPESGSNKWRTLGWSVVIAAFLIFSRSLFRTFEFTLNGGDNYLRSHEWPFYLFDMVPIVFVLMVYNVAHPGRFLPSDYCTIRHGYKKPGYKGVPATKAEEDEQPAAGYSRVSLVPPPLAPPRNNAQMSQAPNSSVTFSSPWNSRPSPGADRY